MSDDRVPLLCYAREVVEGDIVDGRTVEKVARDGDTVTLSRKSASDTEYQVDDEVQVRRLVVDDDLPVGWVRDGDAVGAPEAVALLAAAREARGDDEPEGEREAS